MNRKLHMILAAMAVMFCTSTLWAERKVTIVSNVTTDETEKTYDYYLYNAQGQLMWKQNNSTSSRDVYEYNEAGQMTTRTTRSWIPYDRSYKDLNLETYTYNGNGLVSRMDQTRNLGSSFESKRYYLYKAYDEKGNATAWEHYNASDVLYYVYKADYTYNAAGQVEKKVVSEYDPDYPEDGYYLYEAFEYTFKANGDIDTETHITYKSDGSVKATNTTAYTYSELAEAYAPKNLKATIMGADVQLNWDAVEGATNYVVTYGIEHVQVSGTSYMAQNIATGNVEFTVQAVVNGEEKNAATPVQATVADEGKLPAENLAFGTPYIKIEETDSEDRTYYVVPLTWQLPANHSEIKDIRVYYNSRVYGHIYVSTEKTDITSYELKLDEYEVRNTTQQPILDADGNPEIDEETGEPKTEDVYTTGADINISVVIVYGSGESDPSNIVTVNPYNLINNIQDAIQAIPNTEKDDATYYDLAGRKVAGKVQKGIIIKNGKKYIK